MKTATRLRFSQVARAARLSLLVVIVALLAVLLVEMLPRGEAAPPDTERTAPSDRQPHYQFPTYV
jgi:hypothetical protein